MLEYYFDKCVCGMSVREFVDLVRVLEMFASRTRGERERECVGEYCVIVVVKMVIWMWLVIIECLCDV